MASRQDRWSVWVTVMLVVLAALLVVWVAQRLTPPEQAPKPPAGVSHTTPTPPYGPGPDSDPLAGRLNPAVTEATLATTICRKGYTATIRPPSSVTAKVKLRMAKQQRVLVSDTILDHLVPLQGGGAPGSLTDTRNFLLQSKADSYRKDAVEDQMHNDICSGRVSLHAAQLAIATDWRHYEQETR